MGSFNREGRGGENRSNYRGGRPSFGGRGGGFQSRGRSSFDGGNRQMFRATCDNCGKECEVPFRPTNGKPVYCSDCFEKMGGGNSDSRPQRNSSPRFNSEQSNVSLDALEAKVEDMNVKLEKILKLL